jgi:predicted short-subunit dehydrogenase-like oxidoreductase (DUF2520 family)
LNATWGGLPPWLADVDAVLLAVQDDSVPEVARDLAASGKIGRRHVVLHISGVLDRHALHSLDGTGAALGSLHPLQTFTDPESAPGRLRGAVATVEGDDRAVEMAEMLAKAMGMRTARIESAAKARYHAGAVFASNYVVAVAEVARQILVEAGLSPESAWQGLQGLLRGTFESLEAGLPEDALTGPISRGDSATVRKHLSLLKGEQANLYRELGKVALRLADLSPEQRRGIEDALKQ